MNFKLKKGILKIKNTLLVLIIVAIFTTGALEMIFPGTSRADFMLDNYAYLTNIATFQDNTIISTSSPVNSPQVVKRVKMIITAYSSTPEETDETPFITASGSQVKDGIAANNKYPFGTRIRIPELYGDKIFIIQDRMNSRKGNYHLDIWFPSHSEAENFGSDLTYVEILEN
jgi:3D (Asp-Asp-Asp) domain-containing protein